MSIKLTMSAKKLDPKVNYTHFANNHPFIQQNQLEEVTRESVNVISKAGIFVSTLGASMIPNIVSASTKETTITGSMISPQAIFEWSLRIGLIGLGISFGAGVVFLIASNILKMMGGEKRKKKSKEWNTDIIKGFVQCLVAIPTIFALYYLATTIFGQLNFSNETFLNMQ